MSLNKIFTFILVISFAAPANAFWLFEQRAQKQMLSDAKSAYAKGDYHSTVYITQEFLLKNSGRRGAKEAYIMLGNAYKAMGQYDKAMLKYTEAIEFYPKDEDLTLALADIYYLGGLTDKAIEIYKKALVLDPQNGSAELGLARSYLSEGFFERASKYFELFVKNKKTVDPKVYYEYALSRLYANDYDQALSLAEKSLKYKTDAKTTFLLAKIYKGRGEKAKSFETIALALKQDPSDDEIFLTRALWLAFDKETASQGLSEAETYLAAHPDDRLALFIKSLALYRSGDKKAAFGNLKTVAESNGDGFINKISLQILNKQK